MCRRLFFGMKISDVQLLERFRLRLRFDDGTSGIVDLNHLAGRGVFEAWQQPGVFEQVVITPVGALEWPGEIDLCPDALYLQVTGKQPAEVFSPLVPKLQFGNATLRCNSVSCQQ